jgi:5-methylcytosine-specific restriction endonuclease McrA
LGDEPLKRCSRGDHWVPISGFNADSKAKDGLQGSCRECQKAYQKEYYVKTKEKRRRYHQTRRRKLRRAEVMAKWRAEHPEAARTHRATQRAKELGIEGSYTEAEWIELQEYYNYHCLSCLQQFPGDLEADHVRPLQQGGTNTIDNIQPLCTPCNRKKGTRYVDFRPRWEASKHVEHGSKTVVILDYNRQVEASHRWISPDFGRSLSLRIPAEILKDPHPRIRVTIEPVDDPDDSGAEEGPGLAGPAPSGDVPDGAGEPGPAT